MNWTTAGQAVQAWDQGRLQGEVVLVSGAGWCARDAAGNWFAPELLPTRQEAIRVLYEALAQEDASGDGNRL